MFQYIQKIGVSIQNLSIRYKLGIPIFLAILVMLINQILNVYFIDSNYQNTERWSYILAENKVQSQKIVYLLNTLVYNENNPARTDVEVIIQQLELIINIIDKGGTAKLASNNLDVDALTNLVSALEIQGLKDVWKDYRDLINKINSDNITLETAPDTLQNLVMIERKQNITLKDALVQINILHEQFIQKNDILIKKAVANNQNYKSTLQNIESSLIVIQILIMLFILYVVGIYVSKSLQKITVASHAIAEGITDLELDITNQDELGQITQATYTLANNIQRASEFTQKIGEGNYDVSLEGIDEQLIKRNILFSSLTNMKIRLKDLAQDDEKRRWITEGLTIFSEVIRGNNQGFQRLGDAILQQLIHYIKANQGNFFVLNEENPYDMYLDLVASFAYNRKKYFTKKVPIHEHYAEGMVGQAYMEKTTIMLADIPEDYMEIKSGLGDAPPTHVLIVPFKINQKVEGVIEIASFAPFSKYEIEFLERICEGIASAVLAIKINLRTQKLLTETQELANMLKSQEQDLRQNNEELITTQEEMKRKNIEIEARINAIDNSGVASVEFSMEGILLTANQTFLDLFQYTAQEVLGKHHSIFLEEESQARTKEYISFWQDLNYGIVKTGEVKRKKKDGSAVYLAAAYSIIKDTKGNNLRVLKLATDITETKKLLAESQRQAEILKAQEETLRYNMVALQHTQDELKETSDAIIKLKEEEAHYAQEKAKEIENKNQLITASIKYAQNIQQAILPTKEKIEEFVQECFVIYLPKDIVSGDFYWVNQVSENKIFIAAVDCTGHGVPGAFMSIIGNTLLNEIVNNQKDITPAQVLEQLHMGIYVKLRQEQSSNHDGMDVCLCCLEKINDKETQLMFAGAKRNLYYIQQEQLYELKGDRISIGGWHVETRRSFQNQTFILGQGDIVFLSTDGITDNPNPQRKKFGDKRLEQILLQNHYLPLEAQKEILLKEIKMHQQDAEQRDDITMIGIKV